MMQLSLVIPVRNEAENIDALIAEIRASLDGRAEYEVIYVDDGSSDDTPKRLAQAKKTFPRLRVLRHRESCGQSSALATGVKAARAAWIATLDGDVQNDPADILKPLAVIQAGDIDAWFARHPDGKLIAYADNWQPPAQVEPEFTQPYRSNSVAVWSAAAVQPQKPKP